MRVDYIDFAKGFAIILVVLGHLLQFNCIGATACFDFIYSFHMPLFMLLSGWTATQGRPKIQKGNYLIYLRKRFLSLALPFFVWGLFVSPFLAGVPFYLWQSYVCDLLSVPDKGAWFLINLFCIQIVFLLCCFVSQNLTDRFSSLKNNCLLAELIVCIPLVLTFFVLGHGNVMSSYFSLIYSVSFFTGYFLHSFLGNANLNRFFHLLFFLIFIAAVPYFHFADSPNWLKMLIGICFSLFFIPSCKRYTEEFPNDYVGSLFKLLGKNTIEIYLLHFWIIKFFDTPTINLTDFSPFLIFIFLFLFATALSLVIMYVARFLKFVPYLSLLLFGKK